MTKVESYINYSKNILHNVKGYNLHNARRFYGDEYDDFYIIYLSISTDLVIYRWYGLSVLISHWSIYNTFNSLSNSLKIQKMDSLTKIEESNNVDAVDNISTIYKVRLVPTIYNEKGEKLLHDSIAKLQVNDYSTEINETEWQAATIVNLMEVLNGRK